MVDLNSPYHALLGRPALAKFMAAPHYAYLKLKMPSRAGILTVAGCYKKSMECAATGSRIAEAMVIAEEKRQLLRSVAMAQSDMPTAKDLPGDMSFQPSRDVKRIPLDPAEPDKCVIVGAGLSDK